MTIPGALTFQGVETYGSGGEYSEAGLQDKDEAFERLSRAVDARSYLLMEYLNTDSDWIVFTTIRASAR